MIIAQCPVCQELLEGGDEDHLSALPCGHIFHCVCIDTWLKNASTCPQCRIPLNKRHIVKRIYFSLVDRASTSVLLPEIGPNVTRQDNDSSTDLFVPLRPSDDMTTLGVALKMARNEITRLTNKVVALQTQESLTQAKLAEKMKEVDTVTCLYTEVDKLYTVERQKSRQAKLELSSYKTLLREAETAKTEGLKLRQEMSEMYDLKILIGASEQAATDLLTRYTCDQQSSSSKESLDRVCRWAAVLRSELSNARKKIAKYRAETHRLQRLQTTTTKRVLEAEATAAKQKERANQLQTEITALLHSTRSGSTTTTLVYTPDPSPLPHHPLKASEVTPLVKSFSGTDEVGVNSCLKLIDLMTPELEDLGWSSYPKVYKSSPITPRVNPFKLDASLTATPSSSMNLDEKKQPSKPTAHETKKTQPTSRRPSSLFQFAIMRNFASGQSVTSASTRPYNGMGGHETSSGPTSLYHQHQSSFKHTLKSNAIKHTRHDSPSVGKAVAKSKTMKLDAFYTKH